MSKKVALAIAASIISFSSFAADIDAGKAKSATCMACHGAKGVSMIPMYPHLAGQQADYLKKQLKDFRDGNRKDPVMGAMAKALSDADIENLSAYYASLDSKG